MGSEPTERAGVLLVDKPAGPTSHDVVARARRALGQRRIGHAGTLDPFATGLLLLCVGPATRLAEYLHLLPKRYEADLRLGVETETHDPEGRPAATSEAWRGLDAETLRAALAAHTGELRQRPPAYSAKRVDGGRAHEAARRGERVELDPVTVRVHRLELRAFEPPRVRLEALVSTGTYVRALARDLGRHLGCLAYLTGLRRSAIGPFRAEAALTAERLEPGRGAEALAEGEGRWWLRPAEALAWLPRRILDDGEAARIRTGRRIAVGRVVSPDTGHAASADALRAEAGGGAATPLPVVLLHEGRLLAMATLEDGRLQPRKVFSSG